MKLTFADPIGPWYRYFAWYPVHTIDRGWRWLKFVWKRKYQLHSYLPTVAEPFFVYAVDRFSEPKEVAPQGQESKEQS